MEIVSLTGVVDTKLATAVPMVFGAGGS